MNSRYVLRHSNEVFEDLILVPQTPGIKIWSPQNSPSSSTFPQGSREAKLIDENHMSIAAEHAFKEKSEKSIYIFYPLLQDHLFVFKEVFAENSVLMYS